jgi:hypothetical protein
MARKRDNTRRRLLETLRRLDLAREAFRTAAVDTEGYTGAAFVKHEHFLRGFDWVMRNLRKLS